jgi:hypothetical protein
MVKQKLHWLDLKKDKLTTHDIRCDYQTLAANLSRNKSDEHTSA